VPKAKPEEVALGVMALVGAAVLFFWPGLTAKLIGLWVLTLAGASKLSMGSRGSHAQTTALTATATCISGILVIVYAGAWWEYVVGGALICVGGGMVKA
jgi:hypothetical protein